MEIIEHQKAPERLMAIKDPMRRHVEAYKEWVKENKARQNPSGRKIIPTWQNKVRPSR